MSDAKVGGGLTNAEQFGYGGKEAWRILTKADKGGKKLANC